MLQLSKEVHNFANACEQLVAVIAEKGLLSSDEARVVEYYCKDILIKAVPFQTTCEPRFPASLSNAVNIQVAAVRGK